MERIRNSIRQLEEKLRSGRVEVNQELFALFDEFIAETTARLETLEESQKALDVHVSAIENSALFRFLRRLGRPFLDWKTRIEFAARGWSPGNPIRARLDRTVVEHYADWLSRSEPEAPSLDWYRARAEAFSVRPRIRLVLRADQPRADWVRSSVESVLAQTWNEWELLLPDCLAGELQDLLSDRRIRVGSDWDAAVDGYQGVLDQKVALSPLALHHVAEAVQESSPRLIYSDSDHQREDGKGAVPVFRPGWSPDLLCSVQFPGDFFVTRGKSVAECDDPLFAWPDAPPFASSTVVRHIPRVLYRSRGDPDSASRMRLLERALSRNHHTAVLEKGPSPGTFRLRRRVSGTPLVSIVICSRAAPLLERCIRSIRAATSWPHYEIVVVQHLCGSDGRMRDLIAREKCATLPFKGPFNFSAMNNLGAARARGEILLFVNDDVMPLVPTWLEALISQLQRPGVAIAGAKLIYPSRLLQHAGIAIGIGDGCGHPGRNTRGSPFWPWLDLTRDVSAVTGACLGIGKASFEELGGFDPAFPVNYNDVDLCLRATGAGLRVIYEPGALLRHDECQTRRGGTTYQERKLFLKRWRQISADGDPFYNPNLTNSREDAGLR